MGQGSVRPVCFTGSFLRDTPGKVDRMLYSKSLKLNHIFRRLYRRGQSAVGRSLVFYCRKNGSAENRVGLTVSAKLGHAVKRNHLRRQLRAIYRLHESEFAVGWDFVVVARTRAMQVSYRELEWEYLHLASKSGLLRSSDEASV